MVSDPKPLQAVMTLDAYRADGREHIYPSDASLRWFIRTRRDELMKHKALLVLNGRLMVDAVQFDLAVLEAGHAAAAAREAA